MAYEDSIEIWIIGQKNWPRGKVNKHEIRVDKRIDHPYFAGIHTLYPSKKNENFAIVSASAPDSVLVVDLENSVVSKVLRLPAELYGRNYTLTSNMNLKSHYINNDFQTTHINSAYPVDDNKIVVTTLIQGALGQFDLSNDSFNEICSGFVGCHGGRVNDCGEIYFADSTMGAIIYIHQDGTILRRFATNSRWLHDVQHITESVYACAVADLNELQLLDIDKNEIVF
ncbi:hypothetical protein HRE53_24515 [Acaryochloris sp. 'Moss Beach']|uniref:hypothetical protein n=1 Tax=Acaryochloris sp. 'Moss Beach' TaxID=2740837 RepID=UPI001F4694AF|nr:hypothetical protein [Acaryochloris sp. 'Moss Beach']UJB69468.1 hypothetical protein HRE53_24515 [Acaryochloris sp. 'Moss Beach']